MANPGYLTLTLSLDRQKVYGKAACCSDSALGLRESELDAIIDPSAPKHTSRGHNDEHESDAMYA
jgi:hypothetical protein